MKKKIFLLGFLSLPLVGLILGILLGISQVSEDEAPPPIIGNVRTIEAAYGRWKAEAERNGQKTKLVLALGYFKGLSSEFTQAGGRAMLDLADGALSVEVAGLPEGQGFDVWFVHNRPGPGRSVKPEPGDRMIRAGALARDSDRATLNTSLDRESLAGFKLDLMVVTPSGHNPTERGFLFAAPNVFQKLYYSEAPARNLVSTKLSDPDDTKSRAARMLLTPFRSLVPALAHADKGGFPHFADLIARGEKLFFEEKFQGNGRTCGTCHPAENNLTIDPAFIATLPKKDALFVAEFDKHLNSAENGGRHFEIPQLMRQFGLILENVDGFGDLTSRFVMRGVPHTFAQGLSIVPATFDGTSPQVLQRTGWGGDGAPGGGTLREFAIGAVTQHFTRTLDRAPGVDFRLPTDAELDAMEAFMLSLGRQSEVNLSTLALKDAEASVGLALFNSPTSGKCFFCHFNAGANHGIPIGVPLGTQNANFNTGVENAAHPADGLGLPRPRDGGFGRDGNLQDGFGNGTFNTPSLIEAADSPPFFHNNSVRTIEQSVEFYTSVPFNTSPAGFLTAGINLGQAQVNQVAAFLRVINALENLRSAEENLTNALGGTILPRVNKLVRLAVVDVKDAIRVLKEVPASFKIDGLHPTARTVLENAIVIADTARKTGDKSKRDAIIHEVLNALEQAKGEIVN